MQEVKAFHFSNEEVNAIETTLKICCDLAERSQHSTMWDVFHYLYYIAEYADDIGMTYDIPDVIDLDECDNCVKDKWK